MWKVRLGPREVLGHFEEADLRQKIQSGEIPWYAEAMRPGKRRYERGFKIPEFSEEAARLKAETDARQEAKQQLREEKRRAREARPESIASQEPEAEPEDTEQDLELRNPFSGWKANAEAAEKARQEGHLDEREVEREHDDRRITSEQKGPADAVTIQAQLEREDARHAARMAEIRERHAAEMTALQEQHAARMASLDVTVAKPKDFLQQDVTWKTAPIALAMIPLIFFGIWLKDSCGNAWDKSLAKSREEYEAPQRKLQQEFAESAQREREGWAQKKAEREIKRASLLVDLRSRPTAALVKDVNALLASDSRREFCQTYPFRLVLAERTSDAVAKYMLTILKKREVKEMEFDEKVGSRKDAYCVCEDGSISHVIKSGRGKGACCYGAGGPKVGDALPPKDQADCRLYSEWLR